MEQSKPPDRLPAGFAARGFPAVAGLLAGVLLQSGCVALLVGGAAAGGVLYLHGDLESGLDATPAQVITATEGAFADLKWTKESATASATDGRARAKTAAGTDVNVRVDRRTENSSKVSIRVGLMGDEEISRLLFDKIRDRLK